VFVIEFVGNGKSSRAVVRKGDLSYTERVGLAGQYFTVLDEHDRIVGDASVSIKKRERERKRKIRERIFVRKGGEHVGLTGNTSPFWVSMMWEMRMYLLKGEIGKRDI
jgi:hypothetical protein